MAPSRLERFHAIAKNDLAQLPDKPKPQPEEPPASKPMDDVSNLTAPPQVIPQSGTLGIENIDLDYSNNEDSDDSEAGCPIEIVPVEAEKVEDVTDSTDAKDTMKPALSPNGNGMQPGQVTTYGERFCPLVPLSKFIYNHYPKADMETAADIFFNGGKFWARGWDLFYVWSIEQAAKPLVLVRYEQFAQLLKEINARFRKNKPLDPKEYFWRMTKHVINDFPDHPRFLPRYLGYCDSKDGSEELIRKTPSRILKYNGEPEPKKAPTDEQRDDFMDIYETAIDLGKGKSKGSKKKERETRVLMQAEISKTLKRAQRYLGLRSKKSIKTGLTYEQHQQEDAASYMPPVNPSQPAPYTFENDVIIICVDVEAWERDHKIITEAGFATLDTRDLVGLAPGEGGKNWMEKIRARHFRVQEYLQYVNSDFVQGNPDRFEFGKSELVALKNTPHTIATCFKEPFSKLPTEEDIAESYEKIVEGKEETDEMEQNVEEKRKIVFLGHNPSSDISFLRQVGYDVLNLSNLLETWDTAALYRAHKREPNAKSVGNILAELGLEGWNLHNAGNDAVYTMWILIATCIQAATGRGLKADVSSDDGEAVNGNTGDASNGAATNAKVVTPSKPSQPGKPQEAEVVANEEYQNW